MLRRYNFKLLPFFLVFVLLPVCEEKTQLKQTKPVSQKILLEEENSLFNRNEIVRVFEIPYEKYQKVDPNRFIKEICDQEGKIKVYDFYEVIQKQAGRTYLGIFFEKEAGRFVSHLQVDFFAGIDTLKEVYCIKFTKEFRDCRLSFVLSKEPDMTPEIIYLRSRNDKLFFLIHPDIARPMFFGHGHIESKEFLESAKEAYKLYKLEKDAPPLTDFDFDEKDVRALDTILGMQ
ncbi:hypothetical protein [Leptospira paudalimensis]|uniref:Lipoprotein n=1 Tax=Leptospira paudalimensis TaxID=2950024 RepID=A0ABT3MCQ6_9LEPT|nr:hypothetical protein [Leptospira paudalimensis]MCW7506140.1 hypothetical protein [Leptospira paudalimensis]